MGCISSKKATPESSPKLDKHVVVSRKSGRRNGPKFVSASGPLNAHGGFGNLGKIEEEESEKDENEDLVKRRRGYSGNLGATRKAQFSIKFGRLGEGEHGVAGWPTWLSAIAGEAIDGWMPLKSDKFERLEKIGQGTYSDVYRARDLETGKMVALKKVRFDNFQPESVRFMAREITILRKLDHPNVMKLEGIITSRLSCNIYLVFEYMEHDLSGLLSCPDIKFTDSQIKCYMQQILSGLEHCHSRGILHRDIKSSNILINNEGILKIGDFGLANFARPKNRQPLTSRVVTLWYRAPELLLGSTNYGEAVDLWSVGCVFSELFLGRPILKGRTEVEQLHKIFKLCGSPSDEYWKKSKLPLASMFRPQQLYESTLGEKCKEFPKSAVSLIEALLSIEPYKRRTATFALHSEYFTRRPFACEPSSLPKYPPNKEIDAKFREDARRKKVGANERTQTGSRNSRRPRKTLQESKEFFKVVATEEMDAEFEVSHSVNAPRRRVGMETRSSLKKPFDTVSEASQRTEESQASTTHSVPIQTSSSYSYAKRQKQNDVVIRRPQYGYPPKSRTQKYNTFDSELHELDDTFVLDVQIDNDPSTRAHGGEGYNHHDSSVGYGNRRKNRVTFSGPLMYHTKEMASRQYAQPRSRIYQD